MSKMKVKISCPAKSATQSGRAGSAKWVLEYEMATPRRPDTLMGWSSANDTLSQVKMQFASKDAAIAFAENEGWEYTLSEPHIRRVKPQNYSDNFKFRVAEEETV